MTPRQRVDRGVDWHLPNGTGGYRSRRFARTTRASNDLIVALAEPGVTWAQIVDKINFDDEAKAVAQRFVDEGYGETVAQTMVGRL